MPPRSAGILLYRLTGAAPEILLVHPGGPYWRNKQQGAWMIPKGLVGADEEAVAAALREFEEELGVRPPGSPRPLCTVRQKGGKWVEAFALEGDLDPERIVSNQFSLEWPPGSGRLQSFPEVDRAAWFEPGTARDWILASQRPILDAFEAQLAD